MKQGWMAFSLLVFALLPSVMYGLEPNRAFQSEDLQEAKKKAVEEQKLLFVSFYADWCAPCKWMDQTTFREKEVLTVLDSQYVAVRINIDNVSGKELSQLYDIRYLPTMLIFDASGELLERVEETLSPRKLLSLLHQFNTEENRHVQLIGVNTPPPNGQDDGQSAPGVLVTDYPSEMAVFRLQMGVFSSYDGVGDFVQQLRAQFTEPIVVKTDIQNDKTFFKVYLGQYFRREEADNFRQYLKETHQMPSIVRDN